MFTEAGIL